MQGCLCSKPMDLCQYKQVLWTYIDQPHLPTHMLPMLSDRQNTSKSQALVSLSVRGQDNMASLLKTLCKHFAMLHCAGAGYSILC